jgi:ADP-ribosylglycohydrolase
VIRDVCRITHQSDEAYIGALAVVLAIRFIASGIWSHKNSLLIAVVESLLDSAVRDRLKEFLPLTVPPSKIASQYGASGWVVDTVPLALYCAQFIAERPLSMTLAQAIEVGGDTDTIASITGQIAGTASGVPPDYAEHFSSISGGDDIIRVAESFADFLGTRSTPG